MSTKTYKMYLKFRDEIVKNLRSLGCRFEIAEKKTMMKSSKANLSLDLFTFPQVFFRTSTLHLYISSVHLNLTREEIFQSCFNFNALAFRWHETMAK